MTRLNKLMTVVGAKGTGKTVFTNNDDPRYGPGLIQRWMKARKGRPDERVLIIDTVDHPAYRNYQIIEPEHLPAFKKGIKRIIVNKTKFERLFTILKNEINIMVVCEDSTKYIRNNEKISDDLNDYMTNIKQFNVDLVFIYHSIGLINIDIARLTDILVLFKSPDPPVGGKFGQLKSVRDAYERVMQSENHLGIKACIKAVTLCGYVI